MHLPRSNIHALVLTAITVVCVWLFPSTTTSVLFYGVLIGAGVQLVASVCVHQSRSKLGLVEPSVKSYALVTGASAGLGVDYAKQLASRGYSVILVARREQALNKLASEITEQYGVEVIVRAMDLGKSGAAATLFSQVIQALPSNATVDILVNNAGFAKNDKFLNVDLYTYSSMVQLNSMHLMEMCHVFAKSMVTRGRGRIMNIGSVAGVGPDPLEAVYGATKAFVNSFSRALSYELAPKGVGVLNCCPGATITEFSEVSGLTKSPVFLFPGFQTTSHFVAKTSLDSLLSPVVPCCIYPGFMNVIFANVIPMEPHWLIMWVGHFLWANLKGKSLEFAEKIHKNFGSKFL